MNIITFDGIDASFYELEVEEAWRSVTEINNWKPRDFSDDEFVRLTGDRINCFTTPCPELITAGVLNRRKKLKVNMLDFSETGATPEQIVEAQNTIFNEKQGLLAVGFKSRFFDWDIRSYGWRFDASNFYFLVKPERCIRTGCSGHVCSSENILTTCEWLPEYACIRLQACEKQKDGACGWTPTDESKACFEKLDYFSPH